MHTTPDEIDLAMTRALQSVGQPRSLTFAGRRGHPIRAQVVVHRSGYVVLEAVDVPREEGDNADLKEWLRGEFRFATTNDAANWLRRCVAAGAPQSTPVIAPPSVDASEVARLTDAQRAAAPVRVGPDTLNSLLRKQVFGQDHVLLPLAGR